jgi:hypothetical protein
VLTVPLAAVLPTLLPTGVVPLSHLFPRSGLDPVVAVLRDLVEEVQAMMALMAQAVRHYAAKRVSRRISFRPSPTL